MSEPENFLTRWSRRKLVAEEPAADAEAAPETTADDDAPTLKPESQTAAVKSEPEFDPATLPPLDSIGAQSDISAFLKPGVPGPLRLAALRRAWSADPAIRDFKGLAENDWDFTATDSMRGFGELDPGTDVKKMLAQMFSEKPRPEGPNSDDSKPDEQATPGSHELSAPGERVALAQADEPAQAEKISEADPRVDTVPNKIVQREENIAPQNHEAESVDAPDKRRRPQGSALPQ